MLTELPMEVLVFILARYLRPQDLCALSECCQIIRHRLLQTIRDRKRRHMAIITLQRWSRGLTLPLPTGENFVLALGGSGSGKTVIHGTFKYLYRQRTPLSNYTIASFGNVYAFSNTNQVTIDALMVFKGETSAEFSQQLLSQYQTMLLLGSLWCMKSIRVLEYCSLYTRFQKLADFEMIKELTETLETLLCYTIVELSERNGGTWRLFDITRHPLLRAPNGHSLFPTNKIRDRKRLLAHGKL